MIEVIPNEQTPCIPEVENIELFYIQNLKKLVEFDEFIKTLDHAAGLAANQVSIDGERFMARMFAFRTPDRWRLIIDPHIIEYIGVKEMRLEGCLTWVGQAVLAERSRAVRVMYYNEIGEKINGEIYRGFEAQVWQHEVNHLNGIDEQIVERTYQVPKRIDAGRNDKCPCGSGKKYKQCCLLLM